MNKDQYISPLSTRYASREMQQLFSEDYKFKTWRRLWISLAKAEKALGLAITDEQLAELEKNKDNINYDVAEARERQVRHDVMSHVYAYGQQCPKAEGIIHLGATSCYVGDNTDIIILREASQIVLQKAVQVLKNLSVFANQYKGLPCLAYTHLQPAQLTTVGKRATLWMIELVQDIENLEFQLQNLKLRGAKGTTGTQASFWISLRATKKRSRSWSSLSQRIWALRPAWPSPARPIPAKLTPIFCRFCPALPRAPTNSPTTCGCYSPSRRWRSLLRKIKLARPPCPISATLCAASAFARWRAM